MEATAAELEITESTLRAAGGGGEGRAMQTMHNTAALLLHVLMQSTLLCKRLGNNSTFSMECLPCILVPLSFCHKGPDSLLQINQLSLSAKD